jgi:hypothetical protein
VATPPRDAIFSAGEPQDVTEFDAGKPTPIVATPVIAMPSQNGIYGTGERQDAIEYYIENRRQASRCLLSRRRQMTPYLAQVSLWMKLDTTLENQRRQSRRHQKTSYLPQILEGMSLDKQFENRHLASRCRHKTTLLAQMGQEKPMDTK